MFTRKNLFLVLLTLVAPCAALAQTAPEHYGFGADVKPADLAQFFAVPPDGTGLPPGSGTGAAGAQIFAENCSVCHGDKLQGVPDPGLGGDRLIGGRGSLATKTPIKTVESYWPYATTLFDYIKRAMPFSAPGWLSDDQVYNLVAYILSEAKIIKPTDVINAKTLPKVMMPNRNGFIPDPRSEKSPY